MFAMAGIPPLPVFLYKASVWETKPQRDAFAQLPWESPTICQPPLASTHNQPSTLITHWPAGAALRSDLLQKPPAALSLLNGTLHQILDGKTVLWESQTMTPKGVLPFWQHTPPSP